MTPGHPSGPAKYLPQNGTRALLIQLFLTGLVAGVSAYVGVERNISNLRVEMQLGFQRLETADKLHSANPQAHQVAAAPAK